MPITLQTNSISCFDCLRVGVWKLVILDLGQTCTNQFDTWKQVVFSKPYVLSYIKGLAIPIITVKVVKTQLVRTL